MSFFLPILVPLPHRLPITNHFHCLLTNTHNSHPTFILLTATTNLQSLIQFNFFTWEKSSGEKCRTEELGPLNPFSHSQNYSILLLILAQLLQTPISFQVSFPNSLLAERPQDSFKYLTLPSLLITPSLIFLYTFPLKGNGMASRI